MNRERSKAACHFLLLFVTALSSSSCDGRALPSFSIVVVELNHGTTTPLSGVHVSGDVSLVFEMSPGRRGTFDGHTDAAGRTICVDCIYRARWNIHIQSEKCGGTYNVNDVDVGFGQEIEVSCDGNAASFRSHTVNGS